MSNPIPPTQAASTRTVIIGSGFGGLGAAIRLKQSGDHDFVIVERAQDVGGTWRDNTYPGCRCDVQSNLYSFSFAPNATWSETYPTQPEIYAYLKGVAADAGLGPHLRFGFDVEDVTFEETSGRWRVTATSGAVFTADVVIVASGGLAEPKLPDVEGIDSFAGPIIHSAAWDDSVDLSTARVGVIGTGASAIQIIPAIAPVVDHLTVFQRTPAWVLPHPGKVVSQRAKALYARLPFTQRIARWADYWMREALVIPFVKRPSMMAGAEKQAIEHLEAQVADPELRAKLTPSYRLGCKRILISDDYYPALASSTTTLETAGIERITPSGVMLADGRTVELDVLISATGFYVTDNPMAGKIHGRQGRPLADAYTGALPSYLGTTFPGFPNLFMVTGPNTALGHSSMVFMIESQLNYIVEAMDVIDRAGAALIEPKASVAEAHAAAIEKKLPSTIWGSGCASWYLTEDGRNVTIWPDFTFTYRSRTRRFVRDDHLLGLRPGSGSGAMVEGSVPAR